MLTSAIVLLRVTYAYIAPRRHTHKDTHMHINIHEHISTFIHTYAHIQSYCHNSNPHFLRVLRDIFNIKINEEIRRGIFSWRKAGEVAQTEAALQQKTWLWHAARKKRQQFTLNVCLRVPSQVRPPASPPTSWQPRRHTIQPPRLVGVRHRQIGLSPRPFSLCALSAAPLLSPTTSSSRSSRPCRNAHRFIYME